MLDKILAWKKGGGDEMPHLPEKVLVIESRLGKGQLFFLKVKPQVGQLCYQHTEDQVFKSR